MNKLTATPAAFASASGLGRRLVVRLASLWLTLACLAVAGLMLALARAADMPVGPWIALPFAALCLNLLAALAVHERLRRQGGLLVFHLGLAVLALIAAYGRLVSFDGKVEVTEGGGLDLALVQADATSLHRWSLPAGAFVQGPFVIDYDPGLARRHTWSTVWIDDGRGSTVEKVVGDDRPLVIGGYRFYTTSNKGFAPMLSYRGADGRSVTGAVHLPSYPINADNQANVLPLPDGGGVLALQLAMPAAVADEAGRWRFGPPAGARLIVTEGERRHELGVGQEVALSGGRLRFERVLTWMGYRIFYDPTLPWLAAAALVAVAGLAYHAVARLRALTDLLAPAEPRR